MSLCNHTVRARGAAPDPADPKGRALPIVNTAAREALL